MGLTYNIDASAMQVRIVGSGPLTMAQMLAVVDRVAEDPLFRSLYTVIYDIRRVDYTAQLEDGDAFAAALKHREASFQKRFAIVVPEYLHVLARLYCLVASVAGVDRLKCFTEMEEAVTWCRESPLGCAS
jgi:hypothetical protein